MTHHKNFKNESQDARRHDKHNAAHPDEKNNKNQNKKNEEYDKKKQLLGFVDNRSLYREHPIFQFPAVDRGIQIDLILYDKAAERRRQVNSHNMLYLNIFT